jgi:hypothetical protein
MYQIKSDKKSGQTLKYKIELGGDYRCVFSGFDHCRGALVVIALSPFDEVRRSPSEFSSNLELAF